MSELEHSDDDVVKAQAILAAIYNEEPDDYDEDEDGEDVIYVSSSDDEAAIAALQEAIKNANVQKLAANLNSDLASSNPIEGWLGLINTPVQPLELTEIPEGFSHQTLVIIEVSAMSPSTFMERMRRFVGGLNTPDTMKANVVTVTDGKMYAGLTFTGDKAGGREVPFNKNLWNAVIRVSEKDIV